MIKSLLLTVFSILLLLLISYSCNPKPKPIQQSPIQTLPEAPPITNSNPSGTMTNEAIEDIAPVSVNKDLMIKPQDLLGYIQAAIIPIYKDWVVFENGTYIIFDNVDTIPEVQKFALQYLESYKPKTALETNWDFTISDLDQIEGWSVYGNGYGVYTYVHPTELSMNASPQQVGTYAKAKRALDEKNPKILFVSSKDGILEVQ